MAALFGNNKNKTTIAELEEYYAGQQKSNGTAKAWFMALLSLLLTAAVVIALFFGVRWIWRAITGNNNDDAATTTTQQEGVRILEDGSIVGDLDSLNITDRSGSDESVSDASDDTAATEETTSSTESTRGTVSDEAATSTRSEDEAATIASNSGGNQSSTVASATTSIPNTGAGELLVILPLASGVIGYTIARKYFL